VTDAQRLPCMFYETTTCCCHAYSVLYCVHRYMVKPRSTFRFRLPALPSQKPTKSLRQLKQPGFCDFGAGGEADLGCSWKSSICPCLAGIHCSSEDRIRPRSLSALKQERSLCVCALAVETDGPWISFLASISVADLTCSTMYTSMLP